MSDGLHHYGEPLEDIIEEGTDLYDCWPLASQRVYFHPWHDAQRIAREFEEEQERLRELLEPQHKILGADRDDPGTLLGYKSRRDSEHLTAGKLRVVAEFSDSVQHTETSEKLRTLSLRMCQCRTSGPVGIGPHGRAVIYWDSKCGSSKLCPDEARHEGRRLYDRNAQAIVDHVKKGGRVYRCFLTLPNYPGGRLAEGQRYIFKRFRNRLMRPKKNGRNKFGIEGALVVLEAPLSKDRDWNVHLNVVFLTRGWLDYTKLREVWGAMLKVFPQDRFDEKGMNELFNEVVKYAVRSLPEKSGSKHDTEAPAFLQWTSAEILEWFEVNEKFRRTRSYGCLYGIGTPEPPNLAPARWLGRVDWYPDGYKITWRDHNLPRIAQSMAAAAPRDLILIRGDKSSNQRHCYKSTGPP